MMVVVVRYGGGGMVPHLFGGGLSAQPDTERVNVKNFCDCAWTKVPASSPAGWKKGEREAKLH